MKAQLAVFSAVAVLAFAAAESQAQAAAGAISLEAGGGVALPLGDFKDEEGAAAQNGFGFRVGGAFWFTPQLAVYAGYSRYSFGVDDEELDEFGADADWIDSGFGAGLRFALAPAGEGTGFSPWLEGGLAYRSLALDLSADGASGRISFDRKLGFEAAGGLAVALAEGLSVGPVVRYVRYTPDPLEDEEDFEDVAIQHLALELGLSYRIPLGGAR